MLGLAFAASALGAASAYAQADSGPVLNLGVEVELRHDSNVANSNAARAAARGLVLEDQRLSPAVTLEAKRAFGPHVASVNAFLGYDFYRRNRRLDRERLAADVKLALNLRRCEISPAVAFSRRQSELGEEGFLAPDTPADVKNTQTTRLYSGEVSCGRDIGLRPTARIEHEIADNSNPLRWRSDYEFTTYLGGLGYRHPSIGKLLVFASKRDTTFPNRLIAGRSDSYEIYNYGASFERDIGARLKASASIGYTDVRARTMVGNHFEGVTYSAQLTARVSPQVQVTGSAGRSIRISLNNDALYNLNHEYRFGVRYAIGPRLSAGGAYSLRKRTYFYSIASTPLPPDRLLHENFQSVSAELVFSPGARLQFILAGAYERRDANGIFFDYDGAYVGLTSRLTI